MFMHHKVIISQYPTQQSRKPIEHLGNNPNHAFQFEDAHRANTQAACVRQTEINDESISEW